MKIYYLTPFSSEKRLGHIHNEYCKIVPNDDDWIVLNDPDVMYLHPHQQAWIESTLKNKGKDFDLLGCMTNRIGLPEQMHRLDFCNNKNDITYWVKEAFFFHCAIPETIKETDLIAGFCMIFRKSLWNKIKFEESIQFDMKFCNAVKKAGGKIGIMKHILIYHQYRILEKDPKNYKKHLL